jgi:cytochrome c553
MNFRLVAATLAVAFVHHSAYAQGEPAKAQKIVNDVCAACHGSDGNSSIPANPSIAGQHADYTLKQLVDFKAEAGKPAQRPNPVMAGIVAPLTEDDMKNLAAYFAQQRAKPLAARNAELVKLGQSIYRAGIPSKRVAACSGCHSPDGSGIPAQFPRLAGQHPEYTVAQLQAFRAGERANDASAMMRATAGKLSDREIAALAEYIAGLR